MCTTTVFVRADGRRSGNTQVLLCPSSRFGRPCSAHIEVQRNGAQDVIPPAAPAAPALATGNTITYPPTPTYSPRYSSRPTSRDSTSDRHSNGSRHSSTSSSRRSRRDRSPGIYVNGQRVVNVHSTSGRERVMLVPHPPTPRTPPQSHGMPRTAPPSPSNNLSVPYGSSPRESYNRPYLVDERTPRTYYQVPASPTTSNSSRHSRQTSTSSQGSNRYSYTSVSSASAAASAEDEAERQRRREERRVARKSQELRDRIEKANAEIARRPSVRTGAEQPQQQVTERRSRRDSAEEVVTGAMGRLSVKDTNWKETRAHQRALALEREEREAQAAQDRRLRERMVPSRRASVGPGSRRHRVDYDDGLYRWE